MGEDVAILEDDFHPLGVGDEIGGKVSAVELHSFDHFEGGVHRLRFLDRDDSVLADLLHRLGDEGADRLVVVGGNRGDLLDCLAFDRFRDLLDLRHHGLDRLVDALLEVHDVDACTEGLYALLDHRLREDSRRRGAVAGHVGGLGRHFLDELGAHVLPLILQLDLLGDGYAVFSDEGGAELLVDDDVPALGAERRFHCVCELVDAGHQGLS